MKILVTGNLGYVGSVLTSWLTNSRPSFEIVGLDSGLFSLDYPAEQRLEANPVRQIFGDVRDVTADELVNFDVVVHLAALSNDPMGSLDERLTYDVNVAGTIRLATTCREAGVKHFVFASSCSVYGKSGNTPKAESDETEPLTAYARSKILAEEGIKEFAMDGFTIDCLRFATAAGWSPNLRADLVVNDLVLGALREGRIVLNSDGLAWRPIIDVEDMARAICWSVEIDNREEVFRVVNVGSDLQNYKVREIAEVVAETIPGTEIEFRRGSFGDERSYRIDFSKFLSLAPDYQPSSFLRDTVRRLSTNWPAVKGIDSKKLVRLNVLGGLLNLGRLDGELRWI